MDNGIAGIIASGIASLVSFIIFIGSNIFSRMSANKPYKIKIHEKQLFKVFTPLEILLEKSDFNVPPELFKEIRKIIYSNLVLIPNSLLQEYKNIKFDKKRNIFVLRDIVSTYYNLRKKELGYPFKRESINMTCLDGDEGLTAAIKSLKNSALITLIIFAGSTGLGVLNEIIDKELLSAMKLIFLTYTLLTFFLWIFIYSSFKKKGSQYRKAYKLSRKKSNNETNNHPVRPPYSPTAKECDNNAN